MHDGLSVEEGEKIGDLDPRGVVEYCYQVSDKALAVGGGVLEALLSQASIRAALGT
jgi:xanthine dehydrogenase accessory factor